MQMSVFKRGKHWHFTKTINGVRYRGAFKTARTKAQAEEAYIKALTRFTKAPMAQAAGRKLSKNLSSKFMSRGQKIIRVLEEQPFNAQASTQLVRQKATIADQSVLY